MATNVSDPAARQYAQALLEIGQKRNMIGQIYDDLKAVDDAYRNDKSFRSFFTSPKVSPETKLKILRESFGAKVCDVVQNFLGLLVRKRREYLLDNIMDAFAKNRDDAENRVHVFVESALTLDAAQLRELETAIATGTKRSVAMHATVREELLGGLRIRIGDHLLDNSLLRGLKELAARIAGQDAEFVGAISGAEVDELYARAKAGA